MKRILLQSAATAALFLVAGCSGSSTNNVQAGAENGADNGMAFNEAAPADNVAEAAPSVAPPPAAPAGTPAADAAPLAQAAQVAREVESAPDVERVPFQGGWAWRRHGQILRTASRDGGRISYFRPGESTPFFVQQGAQSFAYAGGRPRRAYDRGGHAAPVAPDRQSEAQRLADQSRHDRSEAEHAPPAPQRREDRNGGTDRDNVQAPANGNAAGDASDHGRNTGRDRHRGNSDDNSDANRMDRRGH